MQAGTLADTINPWTFAMFRLTQTVVPPSALEQPAYAKWLDQRSDRETARADRAHGAEDVIPLPLWIVLFLSAGIIFVFMLFFADSDERARVQTTMMGGIAIVITSSLLLLWFLDHPYHSGPGSLGRSRWSEQSASSTRRQRSSVRRSRFPATTKGLRVLADPGVVSPETQEIDVEAVHWFALTIERSSSVSV